MHDWIGPTISTERLRAAGKPKAIQRRIEQLPSHVASERTPGSIGPLFPRSKPDDKQLSTKGTEGGNRQGMPIRIALADSGEVFGQTRTGRTGDGIFELEHGRDVSMASMQLHWDIFCRVIDNYGDIGICWRLARQLVAEHSRQVRLWVDDLASLQPLCPAVDPLLARQQAHGVEIHQWEPDVTVEPCADVVIEAFACELPIAYLQAMARAETKPCWINLEYLTAESWAEEWHGMASPHPSLPLTKYFFFPGFTSNSGGLLREAGLLAERDLFQNRQSIHEHLEIGLFCYDTAPVGALLDALANTPQPSLVHVPAGKPLTAVMRHLGGIGPWQHGNARIEPIPFMPQDNYDRLLWQCDINFIRGEDSFVRAQWAGKPFIWQIYKQEEGAHLLKLSAFLDRYCETMDSSLAHVVRAMFVAWNDKESELPDAWQAFIAYRQALTVFNRDWSTQLSGQNDLATRLVNFCAKRV